MSFYTNISVSGNKILLREFDTTLNRSVKKRLDYEPSLFLPTTDPTPFKTVSGTPLKEIRFDGIREMRDFKKHYDEMGQGCYGDIFPEVMFISDHYSGEIEPDLSKVSIYTLDIEVDHGEDFPDSKTAPDTINAITVHNSITNTMITFGLEYEGCGGWDQSVLFENSRYAHDYRPFTTEKDLLEDFLKFWETNHPDIITGWYTEGFDIPYLINRIKNVLGDEAASKLSPWKNIYSRQPYFANQTSKEVWIITGISHLDYLNAYRKYSYTPQESYKLNHIAYAELKDEKLSYDEVSSLPELYRTNYQKYIDYNIKDVDIVQRLEEKKGFLQLIISLAYYAKINYDDVASPVRIWDSLIYNHLKEKNIQIPPNLDKVKSEKYEGAYVKDPIPGKYNWVVSIDLASEYPSLMRGVNISPDVFAGQINVGKDSVDHFLDKSFDTSDVAIAKDYSLAANGTLYKKAEQGFMGVLLTKLFAERKADKQIMIETKKSKENASNERERKALALKESLYNVKQHSKKILLNSCYGACGNPYFRFFDVRLAEAVTVSGQLAIRWAEKAVNEYFNQVLETDDVNYVIYIDTDSVYVNAAPIVERFMPGELDTTKIVDKLNLFFSKKVMPIIDKAYDDLYKYMNHREQLMFMDREVIASAGVFCSKKHYFLKVHDSEGVRYSTPDIKIMGMGFITSSIPEFCRRRCKDVMVPIALDGANEDFVKAIDEFRKEFLTKPIEEISMITGISSIRKYQIKDGYRKGTPIGSKSAIIYNRLHKKHGLKTKHPLASTTDKIRYVYLKRGNPIGEEVVGFVDFLPKEFGLDEHVDKELMFEKTFIGPIREILEALGWETKIVSNLMDWF